MTSLLRAYDYCYAYAYSFIASCLGSLAAIVSYFSIMEEQSKHKKAY